MLLQLGNVQLLYRIPLIQAQLLYPAVVGCLRTQLPSLFKRNTVVILNPSLHFVADLSLTNTIVMIDNRQINNV